MQDHFRQLGEIQKYGSPRPQPALVSRFGETRNNYLLFWDRRPLYSKFVQQIDLLSRKGVMRRSIIPGAVAAILLASGASAVTVPDYSFETPVTSSYIYNPTVAGVTFNAGSGVQHNGSDWGFANAPDGVQTAFIQSTSNYTGSISIALSDLVVGQTYQVTFAAAARPNYTADPITVSFGGTQIGAYTITQNGWLDYSTAKFTAISTTGSLIFLGSPNSGDSDVGLDKIRVGAVPEPAIWAMMIIGFGSVGVALRRNKSFAQLV